MSKRFRKIMPALFTATSIVVLVGFYYLSNVYAVMNDELLLPETETVVLTRGSSIRVLATQLIAKDLLTDKTAFLLWGKFNGQSTKLHAGEYVIAPDSTLADLLNNMVAGRVVQHSIALIEGFTFRQILSTIQQNAMINAVLNDLSDEEIMKRLGHEGEHPEGRFYPDTYHISKGVSDLELLRRAYDMMAVILQDEWEKREPNLPLQSPYEALILASIVEKESAIAEERPLIAGLFVNRLRKKMRLQTDPTVIYGIENYDGNIRFRDLRKDTPYNTYTRSGLPPTPIALAGREAIHATLHPDKTKYLYFVAYGDGSGRHKFSTNLKDHEKAVDRYQRKKK